MLLENRTRMPVAGEILPLEIRHYGEKSRLFRLYDDDGTTFDYEQGAYSWTELSVSRKGKSFVSGMKISNEAFFHYTSDPKWVFMTDPK